MARHFKKNRFDSPDTTRQQRFYRKQRSSRFAAMTGGNKLDRRYGWGYAKRRALLVND